MGPPQRRPCRWYGRHCPSRLAPRVEVRADREEGEKPSRIHPFQSLIPLSEVYSVGPNSKKMQQGFVALLAKLGSELFILQDVLLEEIGQVGALLLAEGVCRIRSGEVNATAGYDGAYGIIKLFDPQELAAFSPQMSLFGPSKKAHHNKNKETAPATEKQPASVTNHLSFWTFHPIQLRLCYE